MLVMFWDAESKADLFKRMMLRCLIVFDISHCLGGRDLIDVLTPERVKADGGPDDDFISPLGGKGLGGFWEVRRSGKSVCKE